MTDVTQQTYRAFSGLPNTRTPELNSVLNERYDRTHFALSITPAAVLLALFRAREAREYAVSWRDFKVGAAIVALSQDAPSRLQILTGINIKPDENSELNGHAEQMALCMASDRAFDAVSIVAVVGETQNDQQSGLGMATLHPCGKCRSFMDDSPPIKQDTLIVSALPSLQTIEVSTLDGLHRYHASDSKDTSGVVRFDYGDMSILKPYDLKGLTDLSSMDTEETRAEENTWNVTIGSYILNHRLKILGDC